MKPITSISDMEADLLQEIARLQEVIKKFNCQIGWIETIAKAASALRFTANNDEWLTPVAKEELRRVADNLTEIANCILKSGS